MNRKYGRLANGQVEYAPDYLKVDGGVKVNPSEASYLASGWKRVVDEPPAAEEGMDVVVSSWTEDETTITCVYKQTPHVSQEVADGGGDKADGDATDKDAADGGKDGEGGGGAAEDAQEPAGKGARTFSKLKLVAALKEADKWVLVKTWLEEKAYYDYYLAAQDFAEDHPLFREGLAAIKAYAGVTDDEAEAILAKCVAD